MSDNKAMLSLMRSLKTRLRAPSSPNVDEARVISQRIISEHTQGPRPSLTALKARLQESAERRAYPTSWADVVAIDEETAQQRVRIAALRAAQRPATEPSCLDTSELTELLVEAKQGLEERAAQPDESSEKALDLPDERRPSKGAPIRRLLGFLIRTVLRAWMRKLHGDDK